MAIAIMALTLITFTALGYLALEVQSLRASAKMQGYLLQEAKAERDKLAKRLKKTRESMAGLRASVKREGTNLHATLGEIIVRLKTAETAVGIRDGRERAKKTKKGHRQAIDNNGTSSDHRDPENDR